MAESEIEPIKLYILLDYNTGEPLRSTTETTEMLDALRSYGEDKASGLQLRVYNEDTAGDLILDEVIFYPIVVDDEFVTKTVPTELDAVDDNYEGDE